MPPAAPGSPASASPPACPASGIPPPVEAIILKLLAKTGEERYQTGAGLAADLRRCLSEWEAAGTIGTFPLGLHDVPDMLRIPERLYGREQQVGALLAAFERVASRDTFELVFVSGYSGIGKSSVVNELHKAMGPQRGRFAAGKFDQYKRDIPYATLAQALQSLVGHVLGKSDAEVARWREALREALGGNAQLMLNLIPELEFIIGKQPPVLDQHRRSDGADPGPGDAPADPGRLRPRRPDLHAGRADGFHRA